MVRKLKYSDEAGGTNTLAFVVMPDHFHWLVQVTGERTISKVIAPVKRHSAYEVNRKLGWSGRFWQDGFHERTLRRGFPWLRLPSAVWVS